MFGWFKLKSPLTTDQRRWLETRFDWLRTEFGLDRLNAPIVTPTDEFFPDPYSGTCEDASVLFDRVCQYMAVDRSRIDLQFYRSPSADDVVTAFRPELQRGFALGVFESHDSGITVWLEETRLGEPFSVISTLAHELGHVHLIADRQCDQTMRDHEQLTDLLVVFFGMGLFAANSSVREVNWSHGGYSGWSMGKQGYLTLPEYAYALALYAHARDEHEPDWAAHLRKDVRALFKLELKELQTRGIPPLVNSRSKPAPGANPGVELSDENVEPEKVGDNSRMAECDSDFDEEYESSESGTDDAADDFYSQGVAHATQGEHELAIDALTEALRLNPGDEEAWAQRATSNIALQRFSEAVDDCTESLKIDPDDVAVKCTRASALLNLRGFADALPDLESAIRDDKKYYYAWYLRGLAHIGVHQFQQAIADLNNAVCFGPNIADNYLARSRAYDELGDKARAESDLMEAISRDPQLANESVRSTRWAEWI